MSNQDQQFPVNNTINYHIKLIRETNKMAQLRTSFMQTCNSHSTLFSCVTGAFSNTGSLFNNDDKQDKKKLTQKQEVVKTKKYSSFTCFQKNQLFISDLQRSVCSLINLNINNLSQLMDNQSRDFSPDEKFVHVLQLQNDTEAQKNIFSSLETLKSMNMENGVLEFNNSPNSTQFTSEYIQDNNSQVSQVEPFEL